jgi:hypothetical protein
MPVRLHSDALPEEIAAALLAAPDAWRHAGLKIA